MIFKTIIGPAAEGEKYFSRPYLDDRLWKYLENGANVLISAPRRVGKTSFLKNLDSVEHKGYSIKYHVTESINSSNEYFKRLYKSLLEECSGSKAIWESLGETIKRNRIEKIGAEGIELKGKDIDYFEEVRRILKKVHLEKKLVFIIDEFSETVENILNDLDESSGRQFLHQNRELRQDSSINKKIQFIYCGSIGLGNIAERVRETKSINDLTDFQIPALSKEEVIAMIQQITVATDLDFDEGEKNYLITKIHWLMPYYIQIILDEMETILLQSNEQLKVTNEIIDRAVDEALKKRNYFEHWHTRLRTAFKGQDYTYAKEVLNTASKSNKGISKTQTYDLAVKHELVEDYNIILRTLEYDGYVNLNEKAFYVFNSPLLKIWWERNIAI